MSTASALYAAMEALREPDVDVDLAREAVQEAWEAFQRFEKSVNGWIALAESAERKVA